MAELMKLKAILHLMKLRVLLIFLGNETCEFQTRLLYYNPYYVSFRTISALKGRCESVIVVSVLRAYYEYATGTIF